MRAIDIFGSKYKLFSEKIEMDDVIQGSLGDCYFLSALGSLCDIDNYLKNLIKVIKRSPNKKIYAVKLNINGNWKRH